MHNIDYENTFRERSINTWITDLDGIFYALEYDDLEEVDRDFSLREIRRAKKERFYALADRVNNLCVAYFESKNLPNYITRFQNQLEKLNAANKDLSVATIYDSYGDSHSAVTYLYRQFLYSFPQFGGNDDPKKLSGLEYLVNILESTAVILKKMNIKPSSETEVYNAVKFVCEVTFPNYQAPSEAFVKTAKTYRPDILVPSLNCAVEYKYAETENDLKNAIDQIFKAVHGYSNNGNYNIFYAVFYVKSGILSKVRFNELWVEKQFPKNWMPIFVVGS